MPEINLFLDSSALVAGVISPNGTARVLLILSESVQILITISEQVVAESERAIARKAPKSINDLRQAILATKVKIVRAPAPEDVWEHSHLISHPADAPIVLAAMQAKVDYLVTLNRKHFMDDPKVAELSGLRIGTPGDALAWIRQKILDQDK